MRVANRVHTVNTAQTDGDVALVVLDLGGAHPHGGRWRAVDGAKAGHHKVSTDEQRADIVHAFAVHGNDEGADRVSVREAGVSGRGGRPWAGKPRDRGVGQGRDGSARRGGTKALRGRDGVAVRGRVGVETELAGICAGHVLDHHILIRAGFLGDDRASVSREGSAGEVLEVANGRLGGSSSRAGKLGRRGAVDAAAIDDGSRVVGRDGNAEVGAGSHEGTLGAVSVVVVDLELVNLGAVPIR